MPWSRLRLVLIALSALGLLLSLYFWRQLSPSSSSDAARQARQRAQARLVMDKGRHTEEREQSTRPEDQASEFPAKREEVAVAGDEKTARDNSYLLELKAEMPELVGWLSFPDCDIDEPVVQGGDNIFYLTHDAYQKSHWLGACFLDYQVEAAYLKLRSVAELHSHVAHLPLYGHYYQGGEMFSGLHRLTEPHFAEEVGRLRLELPAQSLDFDVVGALYLQPDADDLAYNSLLHFHDLAEEEEFLRQLRQRAFFWRDFEPSGEDLYLTLTTCSNASGDARLVVLVRHRVE